MSTFLEIFDLRAPILKLGHPRVLKYKIRVYSTYQTMEKLLKITQQFSFHEEEKVGMTWSASYLYFVDQAKFVEFVNSIGQKK